MNITEYVAIEQKNPLSAAVVYLRKNLIVVDATESYYRYVGKLSAAPFDKLVHPDDVEEFIGKLRLLQDEETIQFILRLSNQEEEYRIVYVVAQISNKVEDGDRLYSLNIHDITNVTRNYIRLDTNYKKYVRFLMLSNLYFYEYNTNTRVFKIYRFINDKCVMLVEQDLDTWCDSLINSEGISENVISGINTLRNNLEKGILSFEMQIEEMTNKEQSCLIKGLPFWVYNQQQLSVGVICSGNVYLKDAVYVTSAAKDSGTGLLNKKAMVEYIIDRLHKNDGKTRWLIIYDIDNFKEINDNFGHMFGDLVIQRVADTIMDVFARYAVGGRFGGDEFLFLVEGINTEEELRVRLKTISKHLAIAFADDPEHNIKITTSVGVTNYPIDGLDYQELFEKADKSLYIAKDKGKSRYIIYDEQKHGNYELAQAAMRNVTYSVSGEKRSKALSKVINNLALNGRKALESGEIQRIIMEVFDLDGLTIYTDAGRNRVSVNGKYHKDVDEIVRGMVNSGYYSDCDENGVCVVGDMNKLLGRNAEAYELAKRTEVGSFVHCITFTDDKIDVCVMFDIFNRNRKWSDVDVEEMTIVGRLIGMVLTNK